MAKYRWIITIDYIADLKARPYSNVNAHGLCGPYDVDFSIRDNPVPFRLRDGDGTLYYEGILYGDYEGFEPLDDWGKGNAGAVTVEHYENNQWREI